MAGRGKIAYDFKKTSRLTPAQIDEANQLFEKNRVVNFVELVKLKDLLKDVAMKRPGWEINEKKVKDFSANLDKQFKQGKVLQPDFLAIYEQFLELTETEDWNPEKLDFLVQRLRDKATGLEIKTRKWMFKSYELVFRGHDFIEWLLEKHLSKSREEAQYVGSLLMKSGRIVPVPPPSSASTVVEFKDDQNFWRFIEDDKELKKETAEERKKNRRSKVTKPLVTGLDLLRSRKGDDAAPSGEKTPRFVPFSRTSSEVPTAVQHLISYLNENALEVPGIFRVSGQHEEMINLKKLYDKHKHPLPDLTKYDINTVAGTLKLWLRELPEPLLTFELYEPFIAATSITESEEERLECIRKVLKRLPIGNFVILNFLVKLLINVAAKSDVTKMTAANLAIVFTPTCLRPEKETIEIIFGHSTCANTLFETFIEKYSDLFLPRENAHKKIALKGEQAKYVFGTLRRAKKKLVFDSEEIAEETSEKERRPSIPGETPEIRTEGGEEEDKGGNLALEKVIEAASKPSRHRRTASNAGAPGHRRTGSSTNALPGTTSSAWLQFFQNPNEEPAPPAPAPAPPSPARTGSSGTLPVSTLAAPQPAVVSPRGPPLVAPIPTIPNFPASVSIPLSPRSPSGITAKDPPSPRNVSSIVTPRGVPPPTTSANTLTTPTVITRPRTPSAGSASPTRKLSMDDATTPYQLSVSPRRNQSAVDVTHSEPLEPTPASEPTPEPTPEQSTTPPSVSPLVERNEPESKDAEDSKDEAGQPISASHSASSTLSEGVGTHKDEGEDVDNDDESDDEGSGSFIVKKSNE